MYIYEYCGELSPGDLTDLRSALVNNITFACIAVRYGLHTALLAFVPLLHETINRFVKFQEEKKYAVDVEVRLALTVFKKYFLSSCLKKNYHYLKKNNFNI